MRVALVVTRFAEEGPVISSVLLKVFLFEPAGRSCSGVFVGPIATDE